MKSECTRSFYTNLAIVFLYSSHFLAFCVFLPLFWIILLSFLLLLLDEISINSQGWINWNLFSSQIMTVMENQQRKTQQMVHKKIVDIPQITLFVWSGVVLHLDDCSRGTGCSSARSSCRPLKKCCLHRESAEGLTPKKLTPKNFNGNHEASMIESKVPDAIGVFFVIWICPLVIILPYCQASHVTLQLTAIIHLIWHSMLLMIMNLHPVSYRHKWSDRTKKGTKVLSEYLRAEEDGDFGGCGS